MKKLMIGLVGALAMVAGAEVQSSNVVGCQSQSIAVNNRAMRSAATFLKLGSSPTDIKISDIKQTLGDPGDLTLCLYNDNVTRLAQYMFYSEEVCAALKEEDDIDIAPGWYIIDRFGDPDLDAGPQDADLPLGQGCVINSVSSAAEYTSVGEVDDIKREFSIAVNARKMMGNILPRAIMLSELKQTEGDPGDLTFCTYDNNVTRLAQYMYYSDDVVAILKEEDDIEMDAGWYVIDRSGDPDLDAGVQDFELPSGQGFVVNSVNSNAKLQFPKPM